MGKHVDGSIFELNLKNGVRHGYQNSILNNGTVCQRNMKFVKPDGFDKITYPGGK